MGPWRQQAHRTIPSGATAYVRGVIAAAIASMSCFSTALLGRSREVSSARESRCVCAHAAMYMAVVQLDAAAATASLPGPRVLMAHD